MIKEHERIVLTESVPAEGLEPGDVETVVQVYADGKAYEVEFVALDGHTRAVVTLEVRQVRPMRVRFRRPEADSGREEHFRVSAGQNLPAVDRTRAILCRLLDEHSLQ